jgi:hypothetical protein
MMMMRRRRRRRRRRRKRRNSINCEDSWPLKHKLFYAA